MSTTADPHLSVPDGTRRSVLRPRTWVLLLILTPLLCYWVFLAEMVYYAADLVSSSLMVAAVWPLCLLLMFNALLSARRQRPLVAVLFALCLSALVANAGSLLPVPAAVGLIVVVTWYFLRAWMRAGIGRAWDPLTRPELLAIYVGITVSVWFSSMGGVEFLGSVMTSPFFFADSSNGWADVAPLIPRWISVRKPAVIDPFYHGQANWLRMEFLQAWAIPILAWSLFILCFFGFALAMNTLLRKQWIEHERLTFPIAQIPLQVVGSGAEEAVWQSRTFWLGAAIAFSLEAFNGIHKLFPSVPSIPILPTELNVYFTQKPWNGIGSIPVAFYPWILGLVYLVPLDVSFSSWFFFVIARLEGVVAVATGIRPPGAGDLDAPPYQMDQGFGAFLGLALVTLWAARRHLGSQFQRAIQKGKEPDQQEARSALVGLIATGMGLMIWFHLISQSWLVMAIWFFVYMLMLITISRIRAEAGPGWIMTPRWPQDTLWFTVGGGSLTHYEQTAIICHTWMIQDVRHTPVATQMEGMKIGSSAGIPMKTMAAVMMVSMVAALAGCWWASLSVTYRHGWANNMDQWRLGQGRDIFGWLHSWINGQPMRSNPGIVGAWGAGLAIVLLLARMRQVFLWWPFHPVGYALGNTFSMVWLWCPTLIAWAVKSLVLRYGGSGTYRRGIPFAVGLILGDFFISGLYAVISSLFHVPMYKTFPV